MAQDKIGFGIIGGGMIAEFHAKGAAESEKGKIVAVADVNLDIAAEFAEKAAPEAKPYGNVDEMLKDPDVQVVCICTPSGMHSDLAVKAAQAGKHVLTEKPLDITAAKMTKMVTACRNQEVKLGVVLQRRSFEASRKVKQTIESGVLGKLVLGDMSQKCYRSQQYYDSGGWRGTWKIDGGGACMNQAIHGIDLLTWFMGEVESIFAYADHLVRKIEVEDTMVAAIKYKSGAFGTLTCTTSCNPGENLMVNIHGSRGTLMLEDANITRWAISNSEDELAEDDQQMLSSDQKEGQGVADPRAISHAGHTFHIDDMARAVIEDREPFCNGEDARKAVDLILAIYKSAQTGKEVKL
jgi:predicted dehydrogenase